MVSFLLQQYVLEPVFASWGFLDPSCINMCHLSFLQLEILTFFQGIFASYLSFLLPINSLIC